MKSPLSLAIFVGLTAVAIVAEPFGTQGALGLVPRALYWAVVVGCSIFAGAVIDEVSIWLSRPFSAWLAILIGTGLMTLVYSPFVFLISQVFFTGDAPRASKFTETMAYVFVPTLTVFLVVHTLRPHLRPAEEEETEDPSEATPLAEAPRLTNRLVAPTGNIYRVSANDHLTEVATSDGAEQIRMRFADAVIEMDPVPGCHVHRSHWVVLDAISDLVRKEGKILIRLKNGDELPVSRTYRPGLEAVRPDLF
ncbi:MULTISPECIES: LytTR family DNA-binding domain-containing protein [unclassified Marinovum]